MGKKFPRGWVFRSGVWRRPLQVGGKRSWFSFSANFEESKRRFLKMKRMAMDGSLTKMIEEENSKVLFSEATQEYWDSNLKSLRSAKSFESILRRLNQRFGKSFVPDITWGEIEAYKTERLSKWKPSTVLKDLVTMGSIFKRQILLGNLNENPLLKIKMPKVRNERERILTDFEFRKLLNASWTVNNRGSGKLKRIDDHLRLAIIIADYTAMRKSEIISMKWSDIDFNNSEIFIPKTKNGDKRFVPIDPELKIILRHELKKQFSSQIEKSKHVISYKGRTIKDFKTAMQNAIKASGLEDFTFHDLRHRAITRWDQLGHPETLIMEVAGLKTDAVFKRYSNLRRGDIHRIVGGKGEPIPLVSAKDFLKVA